MLRPRRGGGWLVQKDTGFFCPSPYLWTLLLLVSSSVDLGSRGCFLSYFNSYPPFLQLGSWTPKLIDYFTWFRSSSTMSPKCSSSWVAWRNEYQGKEKNWQTWRIGRVGSLWECVWRAAQPIGPHGLPGPTVECLSFQGHKENSSGHLISTLIHSLTK